MSCAHIIKMGNIHRKIRFDFNIIQQTEVDPCFHLCLFAKKNTKNLKLKAQKPQTCHEQKLKLPVANF